MDTALKYVVLRPHAGGDLVFPALLFCAAPLTHRELAAGFATTHAPTSAGFCAPRSDGTWRTYGDSQSLCPSPEDEHLLNSLLRATALTSPRFAAAAAPLR
jgi:hypothetical protein